MHALGKVIFAMALCFTTTHERSTIPNDVEYVRVDKGAPAYVSDDSLELSSPAGRHTIETLFDWLNNSVVVGNPKNAGAPHIPRLEIKLKGDRYEYVSPAVETTLHNWGHVTTTTIKKIKGDVDVWTVLLHNQDPPTETSVVRLYSPKLEEWLWHLNH